MHADEEGEGGPPPLFYIASQAVEVPSDVTAKQLTLSVASDEGPVAVSAHDAAVETV